MAVAHAPIGVGDVALEVLASSGLAVDGVAFGVAPVRGVHEEVGIGDAEVELLAHHLDHQACERAPDEGDPEADERGRQLVERLNDRRGGKDAMSILAGGCKQGAPRSYLRVLVDGVEAGVVDDGAGNDARERSEEPRQAVQVMHATAAEHSE